MRKSTLPQNGILRPRKKYCLFPVQSEKNRVGRSVKFSFIFLVKNVCFMHVLR